MRRPIRKARGRLGIAIVEVAIVLPIFVTIALATIDTCRVIYIRHSAKIAAYECARIGVIPGATENDLQTQCDAIMTERGLKDYSFVLSKNLAALAKGELLRVTVSVPADANWFNQSWFYKNSNFDESVTILVD
jgi:hypothetical protein